MPFDTEALYERFSAGHVPTGTPGGPNQPPANEPAPATPTRMHMTWVRRKGSSLTHGSFGATFGQDVEPAGRYISQRDPAGNYPDDLYDSGTITFENPLHLDFGGSYEEASNWKRVLSAKYAGKTGKALSRAVMKDGYDAIVTSDTDGTVEIVDLTPGSFQK